MISILIPAHNEATYIGACLEALLASEQVQVGAEVVVIANGCTDNTADLARSFEGLFQTKGWPLTIIERAEGGKLGALNAGEAAARGDALIYLDADVTVSPPLVAQMGAALAGAEACYASGQPVVSPAKSWVTSAYARFWQTLPFVTQGVPGFGVFGMNAKGRARWENFPDIISDDTFARLNFRPQERVKVAATYRWPMVEGFAALVRVRRRQDAGVREIAELFPQLLANDDPKTSDQPVMSRLMGDPLGFVIYGAVAVATRLGRNRDGWARGR